jgi:signal transduction histidine kinase
MDLKKIMKDIFEILRSYMREWKKLQKQTVLKEMGAKTMRPEDTVDDLFDRMKKIANKLPPGEKKDAKLALDGIRGLTSMQIEDSERMLSEMGEIRSYEKNLATLGIATSFMARHVTEPLEKNMQILSEGEEMREKIKKQGWQLSEQEILKTEKMLNDMKHNQNQILHFMKFVSVLSDHISKSIIRNKKSTQVNVMECWQIVSDGFQGKKEELDIEITDDWSNAYNKHAKQKLTVKIDRIDLECILTNLYLNSIESLRRTKDRKRKVKCHYWYHDNTLFIEFSDNGRGIPKNKLEEVFEPFKFGHNQDNDEMHGHGLGLYLVKKIVETYDGTVKAVDVNEGAKIQLVFPKITKVEG